MLIYKIEINDYCKISTDTQEMYISFSDLKLIKSNDELFFTSIKNNNHYAIINNQNLSPDSTLYSSDINVYLESIKDYIFNKYPTFSNLIFDPYYLTDTDWVSKTDAVPVLSLNGIDNYIVTDSAFISKSNFAINFNAYNTKNSSRLCGNNSVNRPIIVLSSDGKLITYYTTLGIAYINSSVSFYNKNCWLIQYGDYIYLYVDSKLESTTNISSIKGDFLFNEIGGYITFYDTIEGYIQKFVAYDNITTSDIPSLLLTKPSVDYNFTEGTGTTITDFSGNNNHGKLSGTLTDCWSKRRVLINNEDRTYLTNIEKVRGKLVESTATLWNATNTLTIADTNATIDSYIATSGTPSILNGVISHIGTICKIELSNGQIFDFTYCTNNYIYDQTTEAQYIIAGDPVEIVNQDVLHSKIRNGYSTSGALNIPPSLSEPTKDVLGNDLTFPASSNADNYSGTKIDVSQYVNAGSITKFNYEDIDESLLFGKNITSSLIKLYLYSSAVTGKNLDILKKVYNL